MEKYEKKGSICRERELSYISTYNNITLNFLPFNDSDNK